LFYERHLAGVSYRDISKELGISLRTASNWGREMRLPQRTGGPRRKRWIPGKAPQIG
jgi:transposase